MIWGNSDNVDLYINYNCDLRCNHCFIGEMLNSKIEMPYETAKAIIDDCSKNGITTITLLGGEPCLHPRIHQIVKYIYFKKLKLRIVSNGQKSFLKFINSIDIRIRKRIHVCFSIDGSTKEVHDKIRGANSFEKLCASINASIEYNMSISGILSVSKDNYSDVINVISFCDKHKMKYLNIHYVTNRGFAKKERVVGINDWMKLCRDIKAESHSIKIRIEETFIPKNDYVNCGVNLKENIIIDPMGRLYGCTMFLDFKEYYTAAFYKNEWHLNSNKLNENSVCGEGCNHCPGIKLINHSLTLEAEAQNYKIDCIFNKTTYD